MSTERGSLKRRSFLEMGLAATAGGAAGPFSGLMLPAEAQVAAPGPPAPEAPHQPIGAGKGVYPGRVVWAHDPRAATWEGPGQGHWWESPHTNQAAVDRMMSGAIRQLAGERADRRAWNALFRSFNRSRGRGNAGYKQGERIMIKANFVGLIFSERNIDPKTYELTGRRIDYMNTSPQVMLALLRQLVKNARVSEKDVTIGDPLALFPAQYYDILHREFPGVHYMDRAGGNESHSRSRVEPSSVPFYWSSRPEDKSQDYVPAPYAEATYLINIANLKSHRLAGVTLCAKNHFGSLFRTPPAKGYYDMHATLALQTRGAGQYRDLVDLMGHAHVGGKTVLCLIDGLYPGVHPTESVPRRWSSAPFNGSWASSLFASQDPVAIDSVGLRFSQGGMERLPAHARMLTITFTRPPWQTTRPRERSTIRTTRSRRRGSSQPGRPRALEQPAGQEIQQEPRQERRN